MIHLLAAELNRLRSRRLTIVAVLVVICVAGLFQLAVNSAVSPPSAAEAAAAQAQYEQALRDYELHKEANDEALQQCLDMGESPEACDPRPKREWFISPATPFTEMAPLALMFATLTAGLAAFVVAASFIGAEYTTGSISNWLTFVPQRWRVFTAKVLGVLLGAGLLGTVVLGATLAATAVLTTVHGGKLDGLQSQVASAGRGVGLVVALALVGFGLTLVARHTAAAIGVLVAYGLGTIVLLILTNLLPALQRLRPYQPELNLQAFLQKGYRYTDYYPAPGGADGGMRTIERTVSMTHGGVYWLLVTVVTLAVAWVVFRRRDVV